MSQYLMQARDSVTGDMYRWISASPDFAGANYTGPNTAEEIAVVASPGDVTGPPVPGLASVLANGADANNIEITNAAAPTAADSLARLQDNIHYLVVEVSGAATLTVNAALYGLRDPAKTHLIIICGSTGTKTIVLDADARVVGQLITVVKTWSSSSVVIEPPAGVQFEQTTGSRTVIPTVAESRSLTFANLSSANGYSIVGTPKLDGAVVTALLADEAVTTAKLDDEAVTTAKIATDALDGWVFGASPEVPTPTDGPHPTTKDYVDARCLSGEYTPTLSNHSNVTTGSINHASYVQVGNQVTVYYHFTMNEASSGTITVDVSLPVARSVSGNFSNDVNAGGSGTRGPASDLSAIRSNTVSGTQTVRLTTRAGASGSRDWSGSFSYRL